MSKIFSPLAGMVLFSFFSTPLQIYVHAQADSLRYTFEMVLVERGSFVMGSDRGKFDERPVHKVTLDAFLIGKYEITQKQWFDIMKSNPSATVNCPKCPVESVSWFDVQEFIKQIHLKTGIQYRLPSEAEWEFAATGGTKSNNYKFSGSDVLKDIAWFRENTAYDPKPVGMKKPNELGIYDMTGNVWEWTNDWTDYYYYSISPADNPPGPISGKCKVFRGGAYNTGVDSLRVSFRGHGFPNEKLMSLGFRLARDP